MTRWPLIVVGMGMAAVTLTAQETRQVFRGGVTTVPVFATVSDRTGSFVLDLAKEEFELRDNGKPQTITQFTSDVQPLSMLVLIDGSGSMMQVLENVLDAANSVVARMLPEDRTAIASFADVFQMRQPFTSNRDELIKHLQDQFNIRVAGETRLWEALSESVLALSKEPGRRVVLVLTDGKQWTNQQGGAQQGVPMFGRASLPQPQIGNSPGPQMTDAPESLVTLALDRNVMIYAIAVWTREEKTTEKPSRAVETLAAMTGGGYVEMKESDNLNTLATNIMNELHQQYVLGFTPQVLDGKTHKLDVKVTRPNCIVRARRSYFAPRGEKTP